MADAAWRLEVVKRSAQAIDPARQGVGRVSVRAMVNYEVATMPRDIRSDAPLGAAGGGPEDMLGKHHQSP